MVYDLRRENICNTGSVPGIAASKKETEEFIGLSKDVPAPENNLDFADICAWTSNPTTGFHFSLQFIIQLKLQHGGY